MRYSGLIHAQYSLTVGSLDYLGYSGVIHAQYILHKNGRTAIDGLMHYAFTIVAGITLIKIRFWRFVTGVIWDILVKVSELKVLVMFNCDICVHEWPYQSLRKESMVCLSVVSLSLYLLFSAS